MTPTTLKENLVDAWYIDASGREQTVEIEVSKTVQEQGARAVQDAVHEHLDSLAPADSEWGFTQTW
jgi:hypothetical protein